MVVDNADFTPGDGGSIGADNIGGVLYVTDKMAWGAHGVLTRVDAQAGSGLPIEGITGGNPVPVSGTFYQATQPVSIASTVNVAIASGSVGVTGSVAVTGTFWQTTQPVSAASLPLPTGASTAANQSTGNTSVASIDTKTPALGQALAAASVPVVLTAAQLTTLTPLTTVAVTGTFWQATQPVSGTFWQATQPVSAASLPLPAGAATSASQTTGNTSLSSIDGKTPALGQALAAAAVPVVLTAAQITTLTPVSSVTVSSITAGSNIIGKFTTDTTTPGTTNAVSVPAIAVGGKTPYKLNSVSGTNATNVKNAAGTLYGIQVFGTTPNIRYLKIYDKASAPTVGTDTPIAVILIPGNVSGGGAEPDYGVHGMKLSNGLSFAITNGPADSDNTGVSANDVIVNLQYA